MTRRDEIEAIVESQAGVFEDVSDRVWDYAELMFEEVKSCALQKKVLRELGFTVDENIKGLPTAFIASWGSGHPVIAILGEYDALANLSQKPDCSSPDPAEPGKPGHGCGHNLLGGASLAATVAVKDLMDQGKMSGTIRYYGCPAEENAGGKAFLVKAGCFDDVDIAITWHPGYMNKVTENGSLANFRVFFTFHGLASHAAGAPHLGRSALDAVELMDVGVNYMREHMIDEARIHYAIINSGGTAPNVVQAEAQVLYAIRAPKVTQVKELYERVCDCARGAALMTQTKVDIKQVAAYSDYVACDVISEKLGEHLDEVIPIDYTAEELAFAQQFREAITELDKNNLKGLAKKIAGKDAAKILEQPIWNFVIKQPLGGSKGSTDVGDVSWVVPTGQFGVATLAAGTPGHAWQVVAQGKGSVAHKGMLAAAKVMAATACDFLTDPALVEAAKKSWLETLDGETYPSPLPKDAKPEIW